jgi:ribosomal protein S12 methylthiotransferase
MKGARPSSCPETAILTATATGSAGATHSDGPVAFVTLGCPKNLVDAEMMLGSLHRAGLRITAHLAEAAIVVVNTCAFVTDAQKESIDAILDAARLKETGRLRGLVVTGCLPQRHGASVLEEIPEVDFLLGPGSLAELPGVVRGLLNGTLARGARLDGLDRLEAPWEARALSQGRASAYLKIGDGCDHACAFCVIPDLRGRHRSRPLEEILAEAHRLCGAGVQEATLVAQDTTAWGTDLYGEPSLDRLVEALDGVEGLRWIRLLYTHPRHWTDRLVTCFDRHARLVPYADIPVQHASDPVLRRMHRVPNWAETEALLLRLRRDVPEIVLRTTVITGFPGETEEDFQRLLQMVGDLEFDHLGAFAYSTEEGTGAARLTGRVPTRLRGQRRDAVLARQRAVSLRRNRERIGRVLEVLVESVDQGKGVARGRWAGQAPEIDGAVVLTPAASGSDHPPAAKRLPDPGTFVRVRITGAGPYDLTASLEEEVSS